MFAMKPVVEITGPCSYCDVAGRLRFENITEEVLLKTIIKGVLGVWRDIAVCHARHCTGQYTAKCKVCKHRDEVRTEKVNSSQQFYNRGDPIDKVRTSKDGYHAPRLEEGDPHDDSTTTKKVGQMCGCCVKLGLTRYILH